MSACWPHAHNPSSAIPLCDHVHHTGRHHLHISHQEIKFGDASEVVRAIKNRITYDEFEYGTTSVRRIESTACVALISAVHAVAP